MTLENFVSKTLSGVTNKKNFTTHVHINAQVDIKDGELHVISGSDASKFYPKLELSLSHFPENKDGFTESSQE